MNETFARILYPVRKWYREYGWDRPIRPEHVPIASVPEIGPSRTLRAAVIAATAFVAISIPATLPFRTYIAQTPVLGVLSVIDGASALLGPYLHFQISAMPSLAQASQQRSADNLAPTIRPLPSWSRLYAILLAIDAIVSLALVILYLRRPVDIPDRYRGTKEDNDFASLLAMKDSNLIGHNKPGIVIGAVQPPPFLGIFKKPLELVIDANPSHVIMDASSRSGKDVGPISMTATLNPYSLLFNDNKSEQFQQQSAIQRDYHGKHVFRLALAAKQIGEIVTLPDGSHFVEEYGSSRLNILNDIPWNTDVEYAALLQTSSLVVCKDLAMLDDGENGHWYRTARVAHMALCYKVMYDPAETLKNISRTAMLMAGDATLDEELAAKKQAMATDGAEVDSIHSIIEQYVGFSASGQGSKPTWLKRAVQAERDRAQQRIAQLKMQIGISLSEGDFTRRSLDIHAASERQVAKIEASLIHPDFERTVRNTMRIRGEEAGSVYSTLNAQLTPWLDPRVIANTATSDFALTDIANADRPAAMFLCNAQDYGDMFTPLYRVTVDLMIRQLLPDMFYDERKGRTVSPNRWPLIFIGNEPMTLGDIPSLKKNLPFLASYGIRFFMPFQLASQRTELYGENEPFSGNAFTHIYHAPNDTNEREAISKMLGNRLVLKENRSSSGPLSSVNRSLDTDTVPVMTPGDIAAMPNDMVPRMRFNPKTGQEEPVVNDDGSLQVDKQAYQIVSMRKGFAYIRKTQHFTDEFPGIYRLMKRFRKPVPPTKVRLSKDEVAMHYSASIVVPPPKETPRERPEPTVRFAPLRQRETSRGPTPPTQADAFDCDDTKQTIGSATIVTKKTNVGSLPPAFGDILNG